MVAFALGLFVLCWLDERRLKWRLLVTPLVAMAVWYVYLQLRLAGVSGVGGGPGIFSAPFLGMFEAIKSWTGDSRRLILSVAILAVVARFVPLALRSRSAIAWGALPFAALTMVLSVHVWREPFDLSRALAPVFTAVPFLVLVPKRGHVLRVSRLPREPG
jgi:hypothetical protein